MRSWHPPPGLENPGSGTVVPFVNDRFNNQETLIISTWQDVRPNRFNFTDASRGITPVFDPLGYFTQTHTEIKSSDKSL